MLTKEMVCTNKLEHILNAVAALVLHFKPWPLGVDLTTIDR